MKWYVVCRRLGDAYEPLANGIVQAKSQESAIMRAVEKDFQGLRRLQLKGQLLAIEAGDSETEAVQRSERLIAQAGRL